MNNNYIYFDQNLEYPLESPFSPSVEYPEYPFDTKSDKENLVYESIRKLFINKGLDSENIGKKSWNPLKVYVRPGNTVLLKPNLVNHFNPTEENHNRGMDCLITHPSIVRCLFDYVYIALEGKGKIIIADAPIQGCVFNDVINNTGYGKLIEYVKEKETDELEISIADLREVLYEKKGNITIQSERETVEYPGTIIDLGKESYFDEVDDKKGLRVTCYNGHDTVSHHDKNHNIYKISSAVLEADVIISLPKPKTHRIAGYTAALKNMIGANARKEFLPHHHKGTKTECGDEYTESNSGLKKINSDANDLRNWAIKYGYHKLERFFNEIARRAGRKLNKVEPERYTYGMWYGNDTIWRTILDINHCVIYANREGKIQEAPQRKILYIGDMVVSGEGEGPLSPSYKKVGALLFSENPVEFDRIVVKLMGFDWKKIPTISHALEDKKLYDGDGTIGLNINGENVENVDDVGYEFRFMPSKGWASYL